jgi:hypothetical protein
VGADSVCIFRAAAGRAGAAARCGVGVRAPDTRKAARRGQSAPRGSAQTAQNPLRLCSSRAIGFCHQQSTGPLRRQPAPPPDRRPSKRVGCTRRRERLPTNLVGRACPSSRRARARSHAQSGGASCAEWRC